MKDDDPIIVVGGGLGGLATALALGRAGRRVRVLEQGAEFGAIGYGIQLGPNVISQFERLGVETPCSRRGIFRKLASGRCLTGEEISGFRRTSFRARFRHPYLIIHRVDLHRVLVRACRACPPSPRAAARWQSV